VHAPAAIMPVLQDVGDNLALLASDAKSGDPVIPHGFTGLEITDLTETYPPTPSIWNICICHEVDHAADRQGGKRIHVQLRHKYLIKFGKSDSEGSGRRFESFRVRQNFNDLRDKLPPLGAGFQCQAAAELPGGHGA